MFNVGDKVTTMKGNKVTIISERKIAAVGTTVAGKPCYQVRTRDGKENWSLEEGMVLGWNDGQSSCESNPPSSSETVQQSNSETKRIIRPKCPACGLEHEKNYVGFQVIECQNWQCKWFKG